ncbi:MAG: hypothetical protein HKN03_03140 [Acidimicrobiales bacterium]|nr:hypothetical protein [Acidimicrobiales bacterium]
MQQIALSRRALLAGIAGLAAYGIPSPAAADYLRTAARRQDFQIRPRTDWAQDSRLPTAAMPSEDVHLLVVHHTLIPGNSYTQDQVPKLMRDIFDYHAGPEKGWPDIAYNFMVDQFGDVWEARFGSLDGPVQGSATGGNQGFSQLCCFLGDLTGQPPTEAAAASMASLLALLADRYKIDTSPGTTVNLVSQGSSRYPEGAKMVLPTLAGHRDVSLTACPGEAGYTFLQQTLPVLVNERRVQTTITTTTTIAPTTIAEPSAAAPTTDDPAIATTTEIEGTSSDALAFEDVDDSSSAPAVDGQSVLPYVIGGGALAVTGIGAMALAKRNQPADQTAPDPSVGSDAAGASVPVGAGVAARGSDGYVDIESRIATSPVQPSAAAPVISAGPVPASGPQRVWWAIEARTEASVERAVQELVGEVQSLAAQRPTDLDADRKAWAAADTRLAAIAPTSKAALVAARSNAVYILRSAPCLVIVERPDGIRKRDESRDALSIDRADVRSIAVHFEDESLYPDIEVTAG